MKKGVLEQEPFLNRGSKQEPFLNEKRGSGTVCVFYQARFHKGRVLCKIISFFFDRRTVK